MAKVGDRVQVTITGPARLSGTARVDPPGNMTISGTIVKDEADHWIVKLDVSFEGRSLLRVLKSSLVPEQFA